MANRREPAGDRLAGSPVPPLRLRIVAGQGRLGCGKPQPATVFATALESLRQ